jgi:hypothetical protein
MLGDSLQLSVSLLPTSRTIRSRRPIRIVSFDDTLDERFSIRHKTHRRDCRSRRGDAIRATQTFTSIFLAFASSVLGIVMVNTPS